jgi:hypothetical protein
MNHTLTTDLKLLKQVIASERKKLKDRQYHLANKDKRNKTKATWRTKNHESETNRHYLRRYGITTQEVKTMLKEQNGLCKLCNAPLSDDYVVEHQHVAGYQKLPISQRSAFVRGLVHHACNCVIGYAKDDITILEKAINYLKITSNSKI